MFSSNQLRRLVLFAGALATVVIFLLPGSINLFQKQTKEHLLATKQAAAVFFVESISVEEIQNDYLTGLIATPQRRVKILIVPGHEPNFGGAEYKNVRERDINVDIANALTTRFTKNPHYDVTVARSENAWNSILQNYFDANATDINAFRMSQAGLMVNNITNGRIILAEDPIDHLTVPPQVAFKLYGINKWTSDNHYDITLHVHINDDSARHVNQPGKYNGFSIYVPDHQYSNAKASRVLGEKLAVRLNAFHATSTYPKESSGVIEDQQLIAIGSNNSADAASVLIEYGYIYEPQFLDGSTLSIAAADYAYETYLGLQDFLSDPVPGVGSGSLPFDFSDVTAEPSSRGAGIYALQSALHLLGFYPPSDKSFADCPISGFAGICTSKAISEYQHSHNLKITGSLGPATRAVLIKDLSVL